MSHWNLAELRLSERDRSRALRRLSREHRRGRITQVELDERTDAVGTARTHGDLGPVFADLGGNGLDHPRSRGFRRGFAPFPFPLFPLLILGIVLAATNTIPWWPVLVVGGLILVLGPRRRRWAGYHGYAC